MTYLQSNLIEGKGDIHKSLGVGKGGVAGVLGNSLGWVCLIDALEEGFHMVEVLAKVTCANSQLRVELNSSPCLIIHNNGLEQHESVIDEAQS